MPEKGGLRRFKTQAVVARPPGHVYRLLEQVELYPRFVPHLIHSERLTDGPLRPGSRFAFHAAVLGFDLRLDGIATEVIPGRLIAFRTVAGPELAGSLCLMPEGEGTRVEFAAEFRLPGGPLGLAARLIDIDNVLAEQARRGTAAFRALVECAQAPDGGTEVPNRDS